MEAQLIDLNKYKTPNSKVFTGRDNGRKIREESGIDVLEISATRIKVLIPAGIYSINPSFFEEFFFNVVRRLGRDKFLEKFEIVSEGRLKYDTILIEAVNRILRTKTALG